MRPEHKLELPKRRKSKRDAFTRTRSEWVAPKTRVPKIIASGAYASAAAAAEDSARHRAYLKARRLARMPSRRQRAPP